MGKRKPSDNVESTNPDFDELMGEILESARIDDNPDYEPAREGSIIDGPEITAQGNGMGFAHTGRGDVEGESGDEIIEIVIHDMEDDEVPN